jgi:hypothetical protein
MVAAGTTTSEEENYQIIREFTAIFYQGIEPGIGITFAVNKPATNGVTTKRGKKNWKRVSS